MLQHKMPLRSCQKFISRFCGSCCLKLELSAFFRVPHPTRGYLQNGKTLLNGKRNAADDHLGWSMRLLTILYRLGQATRCRWTVACHCLARDACLSHDAGTLPTLPRRPAGTFSRRPLVTGGRCLHIYPGGAWISTPGKRSWPLAVLLADQRRISGDCSLPIGVGRSVTRSEI